MFLVCTPGLEFRLQVVLSREAWAGTDGGWVMDVASMVWGTHGK